MEGGIKEIRIKEGVTKGIRTIIVHVCRSNGLFLVSFNISLDSGIVQANVNLACPTVRTNVLAIPMVSMGSVQGNDVLRGFLV